MPSSSVSSLIPGKVVGLPIFSASGHALPSTRIAALYSCFLRLFISAMNSFSSVDNTIGSEFVEAEFSSSKVGL